ncbi:hypothetical protein Bbelb_248290 [Branchiostoma belcheri]|nr:hypothetical protein Bbelb_248290 [Branchiostoma belcheri]
MVSASTSAHKRAPSDGRRWYCSTQQVLAESELEGWIGLGALVYCCGEDKPDRPAEMPEFVLSIQILTFRGSVFIRGRKEASTNTILASTKTTIPDECQPATSASCVSDLAGSKTLFPFATHTRPLIAEDGTAAHHGFWLNLNWKDARLYGGTHSCIPDVS